jgi:hypothetical protein
MTDWRDQEATNETIFREMNEWTAEDRDSASVTRRSLGTYLCECGDGRCTDPISLTRSEYEAIRAVPVRFAIALNHENPEVDSVSYETERYAAVHKIHRLAVRTARDTDPRR